VDEGIGTTIQNAVASLTVMEHDVEMSRSRGTAPDFVRLNRVLSRDIDELHAILLEMRIAGEGSV
jgi:hypothetical protein